MHAYLLARYLWEMIEACFDNLTFCIRMMTRTAFWTIRGWWSIVRIIIVVIIIFCFRVKLLFFLQEMHRALSMQDRMGIGIVNSNFKEGFIKNKHYNDNSDGKGEARIIFSVVKYVVYIIISTCSGWWRYGLGPMGRCTMARKAKKTMVHRHCRVDGDLDYNMFERGWGLAEVEEDIAKSSKSPNAWQRLHESLQ